MLRDLIREYLRRFRGDSKELPPSGGTAASVSDLGVRLAHGERLFFAGDHERAQEVYRELLETVPGHDEASHALGVIEHLHGNSNAAIALFTAAIERNPGVAAYYNNRGEARRALGDDPCALEDYRKAIALAADYAHPRYNRALALNALGRFDEAIAAFEEAIALAPDNAEAHLFLGLTLLTVGEFERGWDEYAWRRGAPGHTHPPVREGAPLWTGESCPDSTLLLDAEAGYGDTIQFVRYAPLVASRCARVILKCHDPLEGLFESACGARVELIRRGQPLPAHDAQASLLDLPMIFRMTPDNVPARVPYLAAPERQADAWRLALQSETRLRVGVVWAGSHDHPGDRRRSCTFADLTRLAQTEGVAFYALQKGRDEDPREWPSAGAPFTDLRGEIEDFSDTAAIIANLDLVIGVDTSVVHLAGALAKPVWTLLPYASEWRWLTQRQDTPWYPTMRLFRQRSAGDWAGVFDDVAAALEIERSRFRRAS